MVASWNYVPGWVKNIGNGISSIWNQGQKGKVSSYLPASGITNNLLDNITGESQKKLAQEQFEYNKQLNQLQMEREDTAYSRTIEDLKNAGLNPNLLLGGSAGMLTSSAGSPSNVSMPTGRGGLSDLIGLFNMVQSAKEVNARVNNLNAGADNYSQKAEETKLSNQYKQIESDYWQLMIAQKLLKGDSEIQRNQGQALLDQVLYRLRNQEYEGHEADGTYSNIPIVTESASGGVLGIKGSKSSTHPYSERKDHAPAVLNQWSKFTDKEKDNITKFENYISTKGYNVSEIKNAGKLIDMRKQASKANSRYWDSILEDYQEAWVK